MVHRVLSSTNDRPHTLLVGKRGTALQVLLDFFGVFVKRTADLLVESSITLIDVVDILHVLIERAPAFELLSPLLCGDQLRDHPFHSVGVIHRTIAASPNWFVAKTPGSLPCTRASFLLYTRGFHTAPTSVLNLRCAIHRHSVAHPRVRSREHPQPSFVCQPNRLHRKHIETVHILHPRPLPTLFLGILRLPSTFILPIHMLPKDHPGLPPRLTRRFLLTPFRPTRSPFLFLSRTRPPSLTLSPHLQHILLSPCSNLSTNHR
mmetsp:Transcript_7086/g.14586  ORF Transcript_7086/g.14586 Transcript_7086/m.14586 type:complete len:262 (-) Transcript_7086:109-894(-)